MPTLDDLNKMLASDFITELDGVFEHAPWVAEIAASKRPFTSVIALHEALMAAVLAAPPDVCLGFLRGHPPLSPKALDDPGLTVSSRAEQYGLGMTSLGDRLTAFEASSAAYEARFGFPFIVCVRRMTPAFVLRALERRLANNAGSGTRRRFERNRAHHAPATSRARHRPWHAEDRRPSIRPRLRYRARQGRRGNSHRGIPRRCADP